MADDADERAAMRVDLKDRVELASHVATLIDACEQYSSEQKAARDQALEYYNGEVRDLPSEEGRSTVVSKDTRTVIKKLMPSVMRALLSNDRIVEYEPVEQEDEAAAEQATDYVNFVLVPECGAEDAIHDAIFDALTVKTGILKWVAYKQRRARVYDYSDQPGEALLGLDDEDGVTVYDVTEKPETDPELLAANPDAKRVSFKLRRVEDETRIRLEAIPRGSFLIHPGAKSIEESPIVGDRQRVTRSELVSRGYDREVVAALACDDRRLDENDDQARQGADWTDIEGFTASAMEEVQVYEVYVSLDLDEDGIAELYRMVLAEGGAPSGQAQTGAAYEILEIAPADEAPYADVVAEREAHQFEGRSAAEDVIDIQRIKTALLRENLDNTYWQNASQPYYDPNKFTPEGLEALFNPALGKPIALKSGVNVGEALGWRQVPYVADKAFAMMAYFDNEIRDRTGITDSSGGVNPEQLGDMTKFAASLISESGIAQAEMIIRSLSRKGIRRAFKGLLKLLVAHADKPRTVKLRGQWTDYDPRVWNVNMDCTVNVGLGAGSKERDLAVLQMILGLQKELLLSIGPQNPYVKPDQLYNTLAKITETAGFPSAEPYFTAPDPQEIAQLLGGNNKPSAEDVKAKMQMQLEQVKAQARMQIEQAQMQADMAVKSHEVQLKAQTEALKADHARQTAQMKAELDLMKHREKMELEWAKAGMARADSAHP